MIYSNFMIVITLGKRGKEKKTEKNREMNGIRLQVVLKPFTKIQTKNPKANKSNIDLLSVVYSDVC